MDGVGFMVAAVIFFLVLFACVLLARTLKQAKDRLPVNAEGIARAAGRGAAKVDKTAADLARAFREGRSTND